MRDIETEAKRLVVEELPFNEFKTVICSKLYTWSEIVLLIDARIEKVSGREALLLGLIIDDIRRKIPKLVETRLDYIAKFLGEENE